MLEAREFVEAARLRGFQWYAGVPCSYLTPFINYVLQDPDLRYVSAANEGDAVALAAGVTLAGDGRGGAGRGIAMMQNSGLGNAVSPLTSLTWTFGLPQLLIVTWRGQPGVADEPQHALMGPITPTLLDTMQIAWELFPTDVAQLDAVLERALTHMNGTGRPYALLMQKGSVAPTDLQAVAPQNVAHGPAAPVSVRRGAATSAQRPSRAQALREIVAHTHEAQTVLLASTGFCGRELYAVADRANHLYMVGSMGCVTPLALGLALARPELKVIALDGDGAALMRLGALATVGATAPPNLWHLLLDNSAHESTGGQATVSATVAFADVAAACGYRSCLDTDSVAELPHWLQRPEGPHFARLLTRTGTPRDLPRPKVTPLQVRERFMQHIASKVKA
ncbi:MAG TPA: phosphonopyruvate decarboxylase [Steroidobacteraceae bacterium]|nr:phosphonopyruvate decarboxylase [Steroidobacteraceae bacterium]